MDDSSPQSSPKYSMEYYNRIVELLVWLIFSLIVPGRFWIAIVTRQHYISDSLQLFYLDILAAILCLIFPVLYKLIFGMLPIEHLRLSRLTSPDLKLKKIKILKVQTDATEQELKETQTTYSNDVAKNLLSPNDTASPADAEHYIENLTISSRTLARRIFSRSGVYLMVGVIIAFSGLVFFYTQTAAVAVVQIETALDKQAIKGAIEQNTGQISIATEQLIKLVPRFGILFFIEMIAFFFLRQYRSAMEEFRYFEAIQRKREESLALLRIMKEHSSEINIDNLLKENRFFSSVSHLKSGETTELLESRKITKDEMDVFVKIIEAIGISKK